MTFAEFIKEARERKGWSQADLARELGISRNSVTQWESGETAPKRRRWPKLERVLGLQPGSITPFSVSGIAILDESEQKVVSLPLYNLREISMRTSGELKMGATGGTVVIQDGIGDQCFAAKVADEAMTPLYRMGDVIIVDKTVEPRDGDEVVAGAPGQALMLRTYEVRGRNSRGRQAFDLRSTNPDYPTIPMDSVNGLRIVGVVIEHHRKRHM